MARYGTYIKFSVKISYNLFRSLLLKVFKAPMEWFDVTPMGRILSRFTSDIEKVDYSLSLSIQYALFGVLNILSAIVLIVIFIYLFVTVVFVVIVFYAFLMVRYLNAARDLRRLSDNNKAPLIDSFASTNYGLTTIRAY